MSNRDQSIRRTRRRTGTADLDGREDASIEQLAVTASQQDELLTPIDAICDRCDLLLAEDTAVSEYPDFAADLERIRDAARKLRLLCARPILPRSGAGFSDDFDLPQEQQELRHEMGNLLGQITGYAELWIDDAGELFLEAFQQDLDLIRRYVRHTQERLKQLVSGDHDLHDETESDSETAADRLEQSIARLVRRTATSCRTHETGRILVVDDVEANCDMIRRRLELRGHTVETTQDGAEALQLLSERSSEFDVVLLDVMLPGIDGVEVLTRLKLGRQTRDIPVIMISALDHESVVAQCIEHGAEDYLSKPINSTFLHARIGACLEKHRLRLREQEHLKQIHFERQRADGLLRDILPARLVKELKETSQIAPRAYENTAVLFADVTSFTPYCEQNSPEDVVATLQNLVECWEESAQRHGVQKIKTIGDAFMAACGVLEPVENPVLNCIHCGLEMIAATIALPIGWNLRVGIHTGRVIGGKIGRRQYLFDLWGDTVNTAARMESHGVPGRINLSGDAWQRIADFSTGTARDPQPVKGKAPIQMVLFDQFR